MKKEIFRGSTKLFNQLLVGTVDDRGTIWIIEQQDDTDEKAVIDLDKENAKALAKWLLKVSEAM